MEQAIVTVEKLRKVFAGDIVAVDDISFTVKRGEIFGFLGPNGAGKSTTIKVLTTLIRKTSGKVRVDGIDLDENPDAIKRIIGYASQEVGVDDDLTARENLRLQCAFHHIPKQKAIQKVEELLETVNLKEAGDRRLSTFSGGMRKRLDLAGSLVSDPKILFLDEPTTGLDPQSRLAVWEYIRRLNHQGTTVFLTTQYMEEADKLANRLCIIDEGRIVAEGVPRELKAQIGADMIQIRFRAGDRTNRARAEEALRTLPPVREINRCDLDQPDDNCLMIYAQDGAALVPEIVRTLDKVQVAVENLTLSAPSLDDVFLKFTGKKLRATEQGNQALARYRSRRRRGP